MDKDNSENKENSTINDNSKSNPKENFLIFKTISHEKGFVLKLLELEKKDSNQTTNHDESYNDSNAKISKNQNENEQRHIINFNNTIDEKDLLPKILNLDDQTIKTLKYPTISSEEAYQFLQFDRFPDRLLDKWKNKRFNKEKLKRKKWNKKKKIKSKYKLKNQELSISFKEQDYKVPTIDQILQILKQGHCPGKGAYW